MHYHLITVKGTFSLHRGGLHATRCSDLIGFVHHTQTATVQLDRRVGHTLITLPQSEKGYSQEELETRLYYLPGSPLFFRCRNGMKIVSRLSVESDTWGIVSGGVLLTCWRLTAIHGGLLRDIGQLSCSLDPPAESFFHLHSFQKRLCSCFLVIYHRQELIINPHIRAIVDELLSPLFSLRLSVSPADDQREGRKNDSAKEMRYLMVQLGNLSMHRLAIYLTDCRQHPCYIYYCPHLIPCSGTGSICRCQISATVTVSGASVDSFGLAKWLVKLIHNHRPSNPHTLRQCVIARHRKPSQIDSITWKHKNMTKSTGLPLQKKATFVTINCSKVRVYVGGRDGSKA